MMDDMAEMEFAEELQTEDEKIPIVFITSSKDFILDEYKQQEHQYLLKPVENAALEEILLELCAEEKEEEFLSIQKKKRIQKIPLKNIIYFEHISRKTVIHTVKKEIQTNLKLSEMLLLLPKKEFILCHQGYIINLKQMEEINRQSALSFTGKLIPISRSRSEAVRKAFLKIL